jgi:hypothetical protein
MADIGLREQVAAAPDLSVGVDASEYDVWLIEQFPASPDLSCYPTQWGIRDVYAPVGPVELQLLATEGPDIAAFTIAPDSIPLSLAATEGPDTAAFTINEILQLAATEGQDTAAFTINHTVALGATEGPDTAAFAVNETVALGATEGADTAAFALEGEVTLQLAATEGADTAAFTLAPLDEPTVDRGWGSGPTYDQRGAYPARVKVFGNEPELGTNEPELGTSEPVELEPAAAPDLRKVLEALAATAQQNPAVTPENLARAQRAATTMAVHAPAELAQLAKSEPDFVVFVIAMML